MDTIRYWWWIRQYGAHLAIASTLMGSAFVTIGLYKQHSLEVGLWGIVVLMAAAISHGLWLYAHTKLIEWSPSSKKIPNALAVSGIGVGIFLPVGLIVHEMSKGSPSPWFGVYLLMIGSTFALGLMVWCILMSLQQSLK